MQSSAQKGEGGGSNCVCAFGRVIQQARQHLGCKKWGSSGIWVVENHELLVLLSDLVSIGALPGRSLVMLLLLHGPTTNSINASHEAKHWVGSRRPDSIYG